MGQRPMQGRVFVRTSFESPSQKFWAGTLSYAADGVTVTSAGNRTVFIPWGNVLGVDSLS